jgi:hypothetical protein
VPPIAVGITSFAHAGWISPIRHSLRRVFSRRDHLDRRDRHARLAGLTLRARRASCE